MPTPVSIMSYGSRFGASRCDTSLWQCVWETSRGWPNHLGACTHVGGQAESPDFWLWPGSAAPLWPFEELTCHWKISVSVSPPFCVALLLMWIANLFLKKHKLFSMSSLLLLLIEIQLYYIKFTLLILGFAEFADTHATIIHSKI